jgi:hypothetical protein
MSPFWRIDAQVDEFRRPFREPVNAPVSLLLWRVWIDELIDQADGQLFSDNGAPRGTCIAVAAASDFRPNSTRRRMASERSMA